MRRRRYSRRRAQYNSNNPNLKISKIILGCFKYFIFETKPPPLSFGKFNAKTFLSRLPIHVQEQAKLQLTFHLKFQ